MFKWVKSKKKKQKNAEQPKEKEKEIKTKLILEKPIKPHPKAKNKGEIDLITDIKETDLLRRKSLLWAMILPWKIPGYLKWRSYQNNPHKRVGVNMEMANGTHELFLVIEQSYGFKRGDKKYLFDEKSYYWVNQMQMNFYDFHENISVPIKREIPSDTILTTIENSGVTEIGYALNPRTLERFERSKIAEGIMKGQAIDNALKILMILVCITMGIAFIVLIIVAWKLKVFGEG